MSRWFLFARFLFRGVVLYMYIYIYKYIPVLVIPRLALTWANARWMASVMAEKLSACEFCFVSVRESERV